jgi:hypothetical protein
MLCYSSKSKNDHIKYILKIFDLQSFHGNTSFVAIIKSIL